MKVVTIGRSSQNEVTINDSKVSRHHCQIIQHDNGSFSLSDFGSTNGTYVNGKRVRGEVWLNPNDVVRIGDTTLQWRSYFPVTYSRKKTNALPIVLGIVGGLLFLLLVFLLFFNNHKKNNYTSSVQYQFYIDGVNFGFDMTLEDLRRENVNVNIAKYEVESNEDDDNAIYYYQSYDYYLISNNTAITINSETQKINFFCTKSNEYYTQRDIHVGCTWGELETAYPHLEFYTDFLYYNYFSHSIETAIIASDPSNCVSFIFYAKQFTETQMESIMSASNPSDFDTDINVSAISGSVLQSIRTSAIVEQICVGDCNDTENETVAEPILTSSSEQQNLTSMQTVKESQNVNLKQSFYLKFQDNEEYTLSDGTTLSASLTTMGIGDLWLNISWKGKSPLKLIWKLDSYGLSPTYGELYASKNYNTYYIKQTISDFKWIADDAGVYGVELVVCPISEEERKYARQ